MFKSMFKIRRESKLSLLIPQLLDSIEHTHTHIHTVKQRKTVTETERQRKREIKAGKKKGFGTIL